MEENILVSNENTSSQRPAIEVLEKLGYKYISQEENKELRNNILSDVLFKEILIKKLNEINSYEYKGEKYKFSASTIGQAIKDLNVKPEPEYYLTEAQIVDLIQTGSLDAFLDCLDFAPSGVIELIKDLSIKIPLSDYSKRKALKDKIGFDVDAALRHIEEEKAEERSNSDGKVEVKERRVKIETPETSGRRVTPNYKIVSTTTESDK